MGLITDGVARNGSLASEFMLQFSGLFNTCSFRRLRTFRRKIRFYPQNVRPIIVLPITPYTQDVDSRLLRKASNQLPYYTIS